MSGAAQGYHSRNAHAGLVTYPKIRALLWEECRVGGSISGVTLLMGLLTLVVYRFTVEPGLVRSDDMLFSMPILGAPLLTALLLIFNPDYSGILTGGYSRRILRLPVPTSIAVAISLGARTVFVAFVTLSVVACARGLFELSVGYELVLFVVALYWGAQLVDWLRAPLSGLSSLVILLVLGGYVFLLASDAFDLDDITRALFAHGSLSAGAWIVAAAGGLAVVYGLAVSAVHAARVGRMTGVPELWELPRRFSLGSAGRLTPFASPVSAQVWFELRRTGWILPVVTLLFSAVIVGGAGVYALASGSDGSSDSTVLSYAPFIALLAGATAQGARAGVVGFRRSKGTPGYPYLQPLTNPELALARCVSSAISLIPTLILVVVAHFSIAGGAFLLDVAPQALALGVTSYREVAWIVLGRGVLAGIFAWALLAISTRLLLGGLIVSMVISETVDTASKIWGGFSSLPLGLLLVGLVVVAYAWAWRSSLISLRALIGWGCAWGLATWLIHGASAVTIRALSPTPVWYALGLFGCLAAAALVPLPYVAVLIDMRRRRHGAAPRQDRAQYAGRSPLFATGSARAIASVVVVGLVAASLWLGWPARAAFEKAWRSRGFPINLVELNDWYPAVPPDENRALNYLDAADLQAQRSNAFIRIRKGQAKNVEETIVATRLDDVVIVGRAEVELGAPLPEDIRIATETYWQAVTSQIAPVLKEITAAPGRESRYPIDLRDGFSVELDSLGKMRGLARELGLDALHWSLAGEPKQAADSIIAILPVADSYSEEPILISQLVRIAILGIAAGTLEDAMNRVAFGEDDLARLQRRFAGSLASPTETLHIDRAMIGESMFALDATGGVLDVRVGEKQRIEILLDPLIRLVYPSAAGRLVTAHHYLELLDMIRRPWREYSDWVNRDDFYIEALSIAPMFAIIAPAIGRAYEAEWRAHTQFDIAVTALALERYRLAKGHLPETLDDLVPSFLSSVPKDLFADEGVAIRYRAEGDGTFVVYSVGSDMEDDGGVRNKRRYREGDITFSIVTRPEKQAR